MLRSLRAAWAEHQGMLAASEALRLAQDAASAPPAPAPAPAAGTAPPPPPPPPPATLWQYWVGRWTWREAAVLLQELRTGTPRSALYGGLVVLAGCGCGILKMQSRGACLDALASLAPGLGAPAAAAAAAAAAAPTLARLWEWRAGWEALASLALWTALEWACGVAKDVLLALARAQRSAQSRALYFASLLRQDAAFHAAHPSGELAARLASDSECLDGLCVHGPERLLQGLASLGTLAWLAAADPLLLALALVLRLPQLLQVTELSVRTAAAYERLGDAKAQAAMARAGDSLANVRVVQAHGAEAGEVAGYCSALGQHLRVVRASAVARSLLRHSEGLVLLVTEVALLAFGGWRICAGAQTLGSFSARREYSNALIENFHGLEHVYEMVRRCQLLLGRYLSLRDRRPLVPLPLPLPLPLPEALAAGLPASVLAEHAADVAAIEAFECQRQLALAAAAQGGSAGGGGSEAGQRHRALGRGSAQAAAPPGGAARALAPPFGVTFEAVTFAYTGAPCPALQGASFHVPPGAVCAFVGASGSGKTTAGRLLQRSADPAAGRILLNGVDIAELPVPVLRQWVGAVDQDTSLLARSVRDNVRLGLRRGAAQRLGLAKEAAAAEAAEAEEAEEEEEEALASALRAAAAADFVAALPGGAGALVGERGGSLSGGQRQRLCLARLILRDPPVAVIDEGTSALDAFSEAAVLGAVLGGAARGTRIVIAHRLATVQRADMVVVFEGGRVVESGPPAELLARQGAFAALWAAQALHAAQ
jgi:ATP-binding cassette subfamily B (MDR/TAP) protein 10